VAAKSAETEASDEATRTSKLLGGSFVAEAESRRLATRAQGLQANAEAVALAGGRLEWEQGQEESRREAHLDELRRQLARLEGDVQRGASTVERLNAEIGRYAIRAPTDGRLGELAAVRPGSVVAAGEMLGALVPAGRLRIAATFAPECLGRLRAGQSAEVRLEAYPWPQFGALRAVVATVGSELRGGGVPVMLEVDPGGPRLPLEHGLVASVSVEVERTTPAWLSLRSAGWLLDPERTPSPESNAPLSR
jgi:multidrug resistance efflux pump